MNSFSFAFSAKGRSMRAQASGASDGPRADLESCVVDKIRDVVDADSGALL
jgi:hypothetical protein